MKNEKISLDIDWQSLPKRERRRLKKELEKVKRVQEEKKRRFFKWGLILGTIIILVGGIFLFNSWEKKRYEGAPRLEVTPATFDFGKVSLKEGKKETSFLIKNSGASALTISGAKTSCDCTTAILRVKEQESGRVKESPIFGMHEPPSWSATLGVGEAGELLVFYEPRIHPVTGPVTREVALFSNDPRGKEKKVTVYAEVTP